MDNWNDVIKYSAEGNIEPTRTVIKSSEEWLSQLTPEQFHVTREHGTERAFSSEMCELFEAGLYACVCCDTLLFDSGEKVKIDVSEEVQETHDELEDEIFD